MRIGPFDISPSLVVAPMAGVTDRPFRSLCRRLGAGLAVSEMVGSDPGLRDTPKTRWRTDHTAETGPIAAQIAGADPHWLAAAARFNVERGAQLIDINMGCPAKKVCNVAAGSALLRDEALVARILAAVVGAVSVPVTLKIRTGWDRTQRNAVTIARIAECSGIQALTVHGRTRADAFAGAAEYDTIAAVKAAVRIPVIANGDITDARSARAVLDATGADALMIGRGAFGRPWVFREVAHFLATGTTLPPPDVREWSAIVSAHLADIHSFYGEATGVRIARKHIGWYVHGIPGGERLRQRINEAETIVGQRAALDAWCFLIQSGAASRPRTDDRVAAPFALPAHACSYNNHRAPAERTRIRPEEIHR
ncbi:MAG: tRNA dihydrouridine synthase DusB [Proteobacteria bacterium]|nr:tRNA dihydrouridine synthase DusB [Burkholderiales bacterium]